MSTDLQVRSRARVLPFVRHRAHRTRVLIAGGGIAGSTLAWWLTEAGFIVSLIENRPEPRDRGSMIDFWGAGYDVAEKMELIDELRDQAYCIDEVRFVDARGEKIGGFELKSLRSVLNGRCFSILRDDLARTLSERVATRVECLFDDPIAALEQRRNDVLVQFESGKACSFDLVIGADGVRSRVRELAFGELAAFEARLGYYAASFFVDGYRFRDERAYVSHTTPRRHLARYALRGGRTAFSLICVAPTAANDPPHLAARKAFLRTMFRSDAWEIEGILSALDRTEELYFERMSQIVMSRWSNGRVALVGDACFCPSALAEQGATLGMGGAYLLARELHARRDYTTAFRNYETRFRPFVARKQSAARRIGGWLVPHSWPALVWRNAGSPLLSSPSVLRRALGKELLETLELPTFGYRRRLWETALPSAQRQTSRKQK